MKYTEIPTFLRTPEKFRLPSYAHKWVVKILTSLDWSILNWSKLGCCYEKKLRTKILRPNHNKERGSGINMRNGILKNSESGRDLR